MTTLLLREKVGILGGGVNTLVVLGSPSCCGGRSYEAILPWALDRPAPETRYSGGRSRISRERRYFYSLYYFPPPGVCDPKGGPT